MHSRLCKYLQYSPAFTLLLWRDRSTTHAMRRTTLIGSALRANACQFRTYRAQPYTVLSSCRDMSSTKLTYLTPRRYSSASPKPQRPQPSAAAAAITQTNTHTAVNPSAAVNPPATTRPPPLLLPTRDPNTPKPPFLSKPNLSHLFATGVAYLKFYKAGLKQVYTNSRLLYSPPSSNPPNPSSPTNPGDTPPTPTPPLPDPTTRAYLQFKTRTTHDLKRLPLFALILLVCGELTPLVVLAVPSAVPLTCRIPAQVEKLLRKREKVRQEGRKLAASFEGEGFEGGVDMAVAKVLGVPLDWWALGLPGRVERRLGWLGEDDRLLGEGGGVGGLVGEEVRLACVDRGVDVLGRGEEELRGVLGEWLRLTDVRRLGEAGRERAVLRLLLRRDCEWGEEVF